MEEAFEVCGVLKVRGKKGGERAQKVGHVFGKVVCGQGRTGTKFPTGHKPPTGAPIRGVARTFLQRGKNDRDKICLVKSGYLPTDVSERSDAKRPSEAREQAAGGLGGAVSPPVGQGRSPGKF